MGPVVARRMRHHDKGPRCGSWVLRLRTLYGPPRRRMMNTSSCAGLILRDVVGGVARLSGVASMGILAPPCAVARGSRPGLSNCDCRGFGCFVMYHVLKRHSVMRRASLSAVCRRQSHSFVTESMHAFAGGHSIPTPLRLYSDMSNRRNAHASRGMSSVNASDEIRPPAAKATDGHGDCQRRSHQRQGCCRTFWRPRHHTVNLSASGGGMHPERDDDGIVKLNV